MLEDFQNSFLLMVIVPLVLSLIARFKFLHDMVHSNRTYKAQSLEMLSKVLGVTDNISNKLVVEQIFISQFKLYVDYETIVILLNSPSPTKAIRLYKKSKRYFEINSGRLVYKEKYSSRGKRRWERYKRPISNVILYCVFAMISVLVGLYVYMSFDIDAIFEVNYYVFNWILWGLSTLMSIFCAIIAIIFLTDSTNIKDAEALMALTDTHKKTPKWCY